MLKFSCPQVIKIIVLLFISVLPIACTNFDSRTYVPRMLPLKDGMVPDFTGRKNIRIFNGYKNSNLILITREYYGAQYYADMKLWTDSAVDTLKRELENRNIQTNDTASKYIKLRITHAYARLLSGYNNCRLFLEVETSKGHKKTFEIFNRYSGNYWRAIDGAVAMSVATMLNDHEILRFIKYSQ